MCVRNRLCRLRHAELLGGRVGCADGLWTRPAPHPPSSLGASSHPCSSCWCHVAGAPGRVTSDGSYARPYCTWSSYCSWDGITQADCANALCQRSGYTSGRFVSGNSMCSSGVAAATGLTSHYWIVDSDEYTTGSYGYESQVTAQCSGTAPPPPPPSIECACSDEASGCTSGGADVSTRCGCAIHHQGETSAFCYVQRGAGCSDASPSGWAAGAYWRYCTPASTVSPSPPVPSPPPPLLTGMYCDDGHDGYSNPCAQDRSDHCCDYDCSWCGPADFCERFSPFRAHSGVCNPDYQGQICGTMYSDCGSASAVSCDNSCVHAYDGDCDDGGPGAEYMICSSGSDCNEYVGLLLECSSRTHLAPDKPVRVSDCSRSCSIPTAAQGLVCSDDCIHALDDVCDDGGPDSEYHVCPYHTDCTGTSVGVRTSLTRCSLLATCQLCSE